ncbi:hypothetical protein BDW59DRAFT_157859 [Aspergillus cavernicola]|uniref:Fungal N-terminal domain-containing protein n=1 Tax=Aspergillus cavernicola TaxID=176166 RepID=A0ABR4IUI9_9EURO
MTVPFGFSASDIIEGVKLLKNVKDALGACSKAQTEYNSLMLTIEDLTTLLLGAHAMQEQIGQDDIAQYKKVATNIGQFVKDFIHRLAKFNGALTVGSRDFKEKLRVARRKIEWASEKCLLEEFKSNLNVHVSILNGIAVQIQLYVKTLLMSSLKGIFDDIFLDDMPIY